MNERFLRHYKKFWEGILYIRQQFREGKDTPFFRRELARFEREVIEPMDREWDLIPPSQKKKMMEDELLMKGIVL